MRTLRLILVAFLAASLSVVTAGASHASPLPLLSTPTITGPIASAAVGSAGHNYPFFAARQNLAARGYAEKEYFFSGETIGGSYTSRMLVRRPIAPAKFSGTVWVEWANVSNGYDLDALWERSADQIMRAGDAYVMIDAQTEGLNTAQTGLKAWSPARYQALHIPTTGTYVAEGGAYDIFAQGIRALRDPIGANPLAGLTISKVIATGTSQSAGTLSIYANSVALLFKNLIDGYLITAIGTTTLEVSGGYPNITETSAEFPYLISALGIPVFVLNTETDASWIKQPPTSILRLWEVAGASHSDYDVYLQQSALAKRDLGLNLPITPGCTQPAQSRIPFRYVQNAAMVALIRWIGSGIAPPTQPGFTYDLTGAIARDASGNALGGVRLPEQNVPTATNTGYNGPSSIFGCRLFGTSIPFSTAHLRSLYPTHADYVQAVRLDAARAVSTGVLLPVDASEILATAAAARIPA